MINKKLIFLYVYLIFIYMCIDYLCEMCVIIFKFNALEKHTNINLENEMYKMYLCGYIGYGL